MQNFQVESIGKINISNEGMYIQLDPNYIPAMQGLDGFQHVCVIWWFSDCDDKEARNTLTTPQPYKNAPAVLGTFATRSPARPNPIALTTAQVLDINCEKGIIQVAYIDANDGTPVLDIKPYTPSLDRVEVPSSPTWCCHWPKSIEESGSFEWANEFTFEMNR